MENSSFILIPIVVGVVEALKKVTHDKFAPLFAIVLGVVGVYLLSGFDVSGTLILEGVIVGLSACGLYSGAKTTFEK